MDIEKMLHVSVFRMARDGGQPPYPRGILGKIKLLFQARSRFVEAVDSFGYLIVG